MLGNQDAKRVGDHLHFDVGAGTGRISIKVDGAGSLPVNGNVPAFVVQDTAAGMGAAIHEFGGQNGDFVRMERLHDDHVEQAVLHRSLVCDTGHVSPLIGITHRHENRLCFHNVSIHVHLVGLGMEMTPQFDGDEDVIAESPAGGRSETPGNIGIQPHPGRAEEGFSVQHTAVHECDDTVVERLEDLLRLAADAQMIGQAVSAATGDDSQGFVGSYESAGHFIHRSVTTDGHHDIGLGRAGQFRSVPGALSIGNLKTVPELPPLAERMETALRQMELAREDKGEHIACLEARKQLAWYLRGVRFSNYYKQQISKIAVMEDVYRVIRGIQRDLE